MYASLADSAIPPQPLTPRQLEVLGLIADGETVADIAAHLLITKLTVRNHIRDILIRTGGRTRLDATRIAQQQGWLTPPWQPAAHRVAELAAELAEQDAAIHRCSILLNQILSAINQSGGQR